ncbi:DUF2584 family protein [Leptolyngbya sp. CCNP1308]|uniref:DUF2584 family protein n=1 Tax=Leptolyngbya sp. CCNP1308 TaxID=3110255 RepID=UPI002B203611|nr:DUF2584 family protein [Leptolyngbya sp. CCNP1308]MEA5448635.1 DUF2584 family protein [Leptolyngbya sp. CCNP1308]
MGMPCEINSLLKLKPAQGYPAVLEVGTQHRVQKAGYRIFPLDVPLCLVDENWLAHADIVIEKLTWQHRTTQIEFRISRVYATPFAAK